MAALTQPANEVHDDVQDKVCVPKSADTPLLHAKSLSRAVLQEQCGVGGGRPGYEARQGRRSRRSQRQRTPPARAARAAVLVPEAELEAARGRAEARARPRVREDGQRPSDDVLRRGREGRRPRGAAHPG